MAHNDDSSLRLLLDDLKELAETFTPTYNADVSQCIETLRFKTTAFMCHSDSLRNSSAPNRNVEFTMAKHKILADMKNQYEEVEKEWIAQLANQRAEWTRKIEEFLKKTELKLPVLSCNGANSDSRNSDHPDGPSNSQYRVKHTSTQTSNLMSNSIQDTSGLLSNIKTEDVQPQTSTFPLLNHPDQQIPSTTSNLVLDDTQDASEPLCRSEEAQNIQLTPSRIELLNYSGQNADCTQFVNATSKSPVKSPGNQVVLHFNSKGSTSLSSTPYETNQCTISDSEIYSVNYSTPNTPNTAALIPALNSFGNTTENLNSESQLLTYAAPEILSPQKTFPCLYCDKTYSHESQLKLHSPKHTGERNYPCRRHCGKKYKHQGTRDIHEKDTCKKRIKLSTDENLPQIP